MNDRKIVTQLIKFGFTTSQAKLYYAGLRSGPELMARLARQAGVRRTTAYYMMEELIRRRYFSTRKVGKRKVYVAASLNDLLQMTESREQLIKKLVKLV